MAVEFIATVGTTDYSFDWITEEITIESGVTEVSATDLKEAIHNAQDEVVGMFRNPIADFGNPVVLTGSSSTFLNVILQAGWKINSFAIIGTLTVGDGNVVSLADGIDIFGPNVLVNFVNNTSSAGVYVSGTAGLTPGDVTDIKDAIFNEVMEGAETFADQTRLNRAAAAGRIIQLPDGTYRIRDAADSKDRVVGDDAANSGRDISAADGT